MGKRAAGSTTDYRKIRLYLYGLMVAASPVAIYYGLVTLEEAGIWVAFAGLALGVTNGVALSNLPPKVAAKPDNTGVNTDA